MRGFINRVWMAIEDQLWLRPALASLASLLIVVLAFLVDRYSLLGGLSLDLSNGALADLFSIFASSMLAVATFSVSAIVTAISAVSSTTTPRAARLVLADKTAQTVLASFITAFIYSVIGLLALEVVSFGDSGRLVLFTGLAVIVVWVLMSFIGWVNHVTSLGRVGSTIRRIETYAEESAHPDHTGALGGRLYNAAAVSDWPGQSVRATSVGYVTTIDMAHLASIADTSDCTIILKVRQGDFVHARMALAHLVAGADAASNDTSPNDDVVERLRQCITVGPSRETARDLRAAMVMLAETADRALSPGINDAGTAIAVLGVQLRVLTGWIDGDRQTPEDLQNLKRGGPAGALDTVARPVASDSTSIHWPNVWVPAIDMDELVDRAFTPVARDGAGIVEVAVALQRTLAALSHLGDPELANAARALSARALAYVDAAAMIEADKARVGHAAGLV